MSDANSQDGASPAAPAHAHGGVVYRLDGKGGVARLPEDQPISAATGKAFDVIVGSPATPEFRNWLVEAIGEIEATLLAEPGSHIRCQIFDDKALLVLRVVRAGVDSHGAGRQSLGVWIEKGRVIFCTEVNLAELMGWSAQTKRLHGPISPGDLVARLGLRAADRLEPLLERIDDDLDAIEGATLARRTRDHRNRLAALRRLLISFRHLVWPQRDALSALQLEELDFFTHRDQARLTEAVQRTARVGDELQALSERAVLVHEHILDQRAEQMNRAMLILAVVTTVFMPLSLITGMFGMNLQGIPLGDHPHGFWIVTGFLIVLAVVEIVWFMRKKWF